MTTATRITGKSITFIGPSAEEEVLKSRHDDIYPANPENPHGWPKWRRVITNTRDGIAVVYTHHEA